MAANDGGDSSGTEYSECRAWRDDPMAGPQDAGAERRRTGTSDTRARTRARRARRQGPVKAGAPHARRRAAQRASAGGRVHRRPAAGSGQATRRGYAPAEPSAVAPRVGERRTTARRATTRRKERGSSHGGPSAGASVSTSPPPAKEGGRGDAAVPSDRASGGGTRQHRGGTARRRRSSTGRQARRSRRRSGDDDELDAQFAHWRRGGMRQLVPWQAPGPPAMGARKARGTRGVVVPADGTGAVSAPSSAGGMAVAAPAGPHARPPTAVRVRVRPRHEDPYVQDDVDVPGASVCRRGRRVVMPPQPSPVPVSPVASHRRPPSSSRDPVIIFEYGLSRRASWGGSSPSGDNTRRGRGSSQSPDAWRLQVTPAAGTAVDNAAARSVPHASTTGAAPPRPCSAITSRSRVSLASPVVQGHRSRGFTVPPPVLTARSVSHSGDEAGVSEGAVADPGVDGAAAAPTAVGGRTRQVYTRRAGPAWSPHANNSCSGGDSDGAGGAADTSSRQRVRKARGKRPRTAPPTRRQQSRPGASTAAGTAAKPGRRTRPSTALGRRDARSGRANGGTRVPSSGRQRAARRKAGVFVQGSGKGGEQKQKTLGDTDVVEVVLLHASRQVWYPKPPPLLNDTATAKPPLRRKARPGAGKQGKAGTRRVKPARRQAAQGSGGDGDGDGSSGRTGDGTAAVVPSQAEDTPPTAAHGGGDSGEAGPAGPESWPKRKPEGRFRVGRATPVTKLRLVPKTRAGAAIVLRLSNTRDVEAQGWGKPEPAGWQPFNSAAAQHPARTWSFMLREGTGVLPVHPPPKGRQQHGAQQQRGRQLSRGASSRRSVNSSSRHLTRPRSADPVARVKSSVSLGRGGGHHQGATRSVSPRPPLPRHHSRRSTSTSPRSVRGLGRGDSTISEGTALTGASHPAHGSSEAHAHAGVAAAPSSSSSSFRRVVRPAGGTWGANVRRARRAAKFVSRYKRGAGGGEAVAGATGPGSGSGGGGALPDGNHAADGTPLASPRSSTSLSPTSRARQGAFMASPLLPRRHRIQQQERWENTARVLGLGKPAGSGSADEWDEDTTANVYATIGRLEHGDARGGGPGRDLSPGTVAGGSPGDVYRGAYGEEGGSGGSAAAAAAAAAAPYMTREERRQARQRAAIMRRTVKWDADLEDAFQEFQAAVLVDRPDKYTSSSSTTNRANVRIEDFLRSRQFKMWFTTTAPAWLVKAQALRLAAAMQRGESTEQQKLEVGVYQRARQVYVLRQFAFVMRGANSGTGGSSGGEGGGDGGAKAGLFSGLRSRFQLAMEQRAKRIAAAAASGKGAGGSSMPGAEPAAVPFTDHERVLAAEVIQHAFRRTLGKELAQAQARAQAADAGNGPVAELDGQTHGGAGAGDIAGAGARETRAESGSGGAADSSDNDSNAGGGGGGGGCRDPELGGAPPRSDDDEEDDGTGGTGGSGSRGGGRGGGGGGGGGGAGAADAGSVGGADGADGGGGGGDGTGGGATATECSEGAPEPDTTGHQPSAHSEAGGVARETSPGHEGARSQPGGNMTRDSTEAPPQVADADDAQLPQRSASGGAEGEWPSLPPSTPAANQATPPTADVQSQPHVGSGANTGVRADGWAADGATAASGLGGGHQPSQGAPVVAVISASGPAPEPLPTTTASGALPAAMSQQSKPRPSTRPRATEPSPTVATHATRAPSPPQSTDATSAVPAAAPGDGGHDSALQDLDKAATWAVICERARVRRAAADQAAAAAAAERARATAAAKALSDAEAQAQEAAAAAAAAAAHMAQRRGAVALRRERQRREAATARGAAVQVAQARLTQARARRWGVRRCPTRPGSQHGRRSPRGLHAPSSGRGQARSDDGTAAVGPQGHTRGVDVATNGDSAASQIRTQAELDGTAAMSQTHAAGTPARERERDVDTRVEHTAAVTGGDSSASGLVYWSRRANQVLLRGEFAQKSASTTASTGVGIAAAKRRSTGASRGIHPTGPVAAADDGKLAQVSDSLRRLERQRAASEAAFSARRSRQWLQQLQALDMVHDAAIAAAVATAAPGLVMGAHTLSSDGYSVA